MKSPVFVTALLTLTVAACTHPDERATCALTPPEAIVDYTCENEETMSVIWWRDVAEVSIADNVWCLPRARSGSGARYTDGKHEIWDHQSEVRVTDGAALKTVCRKSP